MPRSPIRSYVSPRWPAAAAWVAGCAVLGLGCSLFDNLDRFSQQHDAGHPKKKPDAGRPDAGKDAGTGASDAGSADAGSEAGADAGAKDAGGDAGKDAGSGPEGCASPRTLCVRLQHFTPHVNQLAGIDLVTADSILRARVLLDPLAANGGSDADAVLPLAIPASEVPAPGQKHPLHLEIFGDANEDGQYTPDGKDHDWKVDLPADGTLVFAHNSQFSRLLPRPASIGGDFHMHFTGMGIHTGKTLEVMVIEQDSGRAVGLYRLQSIASDAFEISIPGIIDVGGVTYRVEFYADVNGNLRYDDPPVDHAWVEFAESNGQGVDFTFAHGTNFTALKYQFLFAP